MKIQVSVNTYVSVLNALTEYSDSVDENKSTVVQLCLQYVLKNEIDISDATQKIVSELNSKEIQKSIISSLPSHILELYSQTVDPDECKDYIVRLIEKLGVFKSVRKQTTFSINIDLINQVNLMPVNKSHFVIDSFLYCLQNELLEDVFDQNNIEDDVDVITEDGYKNLLDV